MQRTGILVFLITLFTLTFPNLSAHAANRVEFILDVSGSMGALAAGEKKVDSAKKAIANTVQAIPDGSIVALRFYGHRIPNQQKAESCVDSELVIPFGPINKAQFLAALQKANPLGQTPIAYSLEQAAKDFGEMKDEEAVIILVSDGAETCGGDPVQVAKDLIAKGFKVKINTIGFDVDEATKAQLMGISNASGGTYADAKDTAALTQSLEKMTQESLVIEKEKSVYGSEIRGGDSYETAVALPAGKEFRLDHHQKKNDFDYFYVDLKGGQRLVVTFQTGEKGVNIPQGAGQVKENENPYAGAQIHNSDRQKLASDQIIGSRNAKRTLSLPLGRGQGGRYYVLIGNTYDDQNKDNPFQIEVVDEFDAGSQEDAGAKEPEAVAISPGEMKGHLNNNDKVDMFKFQAAPGATYSIKARPNTDMRIRLTLFDADGVQLARADSPNEGAASKLENFQTPQGGEIFLEVSTYYSNIKPTEYSLDLAQAGGETATETKPAEAAKAPPAPAEAKPAAPAQAEPKKEADHAPPFTGVETVEELHGLLQGLSFWQQAKWYLIYSGVPLLVGWLVGMIWGYVKGRKAGKRKAQAQKPPTPSP